MIKHLFYGGPSVEALREDYAKKGLIDKKAQVQAAAEIVVNAPISKVWEIVFAMANWSKVDPQFQIKDLQSVTVDAPIQFVVNNFSISATFAVVEPKKELTWVGKSLWIKAIDRHILEKIDDQTTRLSVEESMSGALLPLMMSSKNLKKQQEQWLVKFKEAIEK